jgi:gamma-glutamyltranspeptidase/glutathione hydrolase
MKSFIPGKASTSKEINHGDAYYRESDQTTHLSVADKNGNIVSLTTTINDIFGSKLVVEGAGFFLNDEMDDFSIKPGTPNMFGLIGNDANAIQPRKRMLSSMTPVIILKNNEPFLTLGSPGGSRIITTVLQTFINIVEYNKTLGEAIDLPRFHHQWFPDEIQFEKGYLDSNKSKLLREMGYNLKTVSDFGRVDAIMFKDGYFISHTDRRGSGLAISY